MTVAGVLALTGLVAFYILGAYLGYHFMSEPKPAKGPYAAAGAVGFVAAFALMLPVMRAALILHDREEEILSLSLSIALLVTAQGIGLPLVIRRWMV